ncbi:hypothetical protein ABZ654_40935, partial [Streptomyces hygroscopicus]
MDTPRFGVPERLAQRMTMAEQHAYLRDRLSRRRVLRGGAAAAGTVAGAGLLAGDRRRAPPVPGPRRRGTGRRRPRQIGR